MPFTNMSDGRNFTDYRSQREQMSTYGDRFSTHDSMSLRQAMTGNAEKVIENPGCNRKQAAGMSVQCGGPISQYVSTKSTITDFPTGPLGSKQ